MTVTAPDTSVVNLVRIADALPVLRITGQAWHIPESRRESRPLEVGTRVAIGDTVAVSAEGEVRLGAVSLAGGARGMAYAFVREDAFRPSRTRADVPRILAELTTMRDDQLPSPPATERDIATATEFARTNLTLDGGQELSRAMARRHRAVCLFISEETAFVAFESLNVARLRAVVEAIERPVQPQLVPAGVLAELFERIYGEPI